MPVASRSRRSRTEAQWWRSAPKDFEDCADRAEKAKSKEEKTSQLADCNAKFAGRRKAGGGYTYYDFMQDRSFDIAGPNPTAEEQKKIDQQYTAYLDSQRRDNIANAFAAKQHQGSAAADAAPVQHGIQKVALRTDTEKSAGAGCQSAQAGRAHQSRPLREKCILVRMAAAIARPDDLKRLFSPSPPAAKAKRS